MSEKDIIRAVLVKPGEEPEIIEFEHTLEEMQRLVGGGLIQAIYPFDDDAALICNDEGKILGMPLNRALYDLRDEIYDIIAGDFFICRAPADSDTFASLTDDQIDKYMERFRYPEEFVRMWSRVEVVEKKPHSRDYER